MQSSNRAAKAGKCGLAATLSPLPQAGRSRHRAAVPHARGRLRHAPSRSAVPVAGAQMTAQMRDRDGRGACAHRASIDPGSFTRSQRTTAQRRAPSGDTAGRSAPRAVPGNVPDWARHTGIGGRSMICGNRVAAAVAGRLRGRGRRNRSRRSCVVTRRAGERWSVLELEPVLDGPRWARRFTETVLHAWRLSPAVIETAELLVSWLVIEAFDHNPDLPVMMGPDLDSDSGRGLLLVQALSKEWGYQYLESGGKLVFCILGTPELTSNAQSGGCFLP